MIQSARRLVRVVAIDHSPVGRERIKQICAGLPDVRIVGEATNAAKALSTAARMRPDVVVVNYDLPNGSAFSVVHELMATAAVPVIMVVWNPAPDVGAREVKALEAGAVAFVDMSPRLGKDNGAPIDQALVRTIRVMSEIKVVHRRRGRLTESLAAGRAAGDSVDQSPSEVKRAPARSLAERAGTEVTTPVHVLEVVAVGASTGGPLAFQSIIARLPRPFPVPILLAQHMTPGFQVNFIQWLRESTGLRVHLAEQGVLPLAGEVYVAPDTQHMGVDGDKRIVLSPGPLENGSRPSVSFLFRSVADAYGPHAVGVLLTGMGRDGARELLHLRDLGAVTIAQDEESSVVHGMPGEAIKLKAARYIVPPEKIADILGHLFRRSRPPVDGPESRAVSAGRGS